LKVSGDREMEERRAVVLLSGGLDSATTLAVAQAEGYAPYALTIAYGQRHAFEVQAARRVAAAMGVRRHLELTVPLAEFGGSALTGTTPVPKGRTDQQMVAGIPVTYVPARNTVFLSLALAWAETLRCYNLFIGVNAVDYSGYPDCRPEYIAAFEKMANLATQAGVEGRGRFRIHTPLIDLPKHAIILRGLELDVDYGLTHSCYDPDTTGRPCGECDACILRQKGFAAAGVRDPLSDVDRQL
jgi:7-cyano-7-deazaguanine synthase